MKLDDIKQAIDKIESEVKDIKSKRKSDESYIKKLNKSKVFFN